MDFVLQVIGWVIFIYGFLSLAQDIISEVTSQKINHNMKIIVLVKNLEEDLENFSRELADIRRKNAYKNITVIDMEEKDNIHNVIKKFDEDEVNIKVLNRKEGEEFIEETFKI